MDRTRDNMGFRELMALDKLARFGQFVKGNGGVIGSIKKLYRFVFLPFFEVYFLSDCLFAEWMCLKPERWLVRTSLETNTMRTTCFSTAPIVGWNIRISFISIMMEVKSLQSGTPGCII